ncbi:MAG: flagellar hook-associated protein FlgK [Planctomycetota bacterium]|jgi:flagellar hook-associated protein 1 FlgK|nr:flagellar hook-associated protein FlgK [Planctomycetota bacterium]
MTFRSFNIGMTSLQATQLMLDTTGHNVANATTPGYSRQRVNTEANKPQPYGNVAVGTGVLVNDITSITDVFLEQQVRVATSTYGQLNQKNTGYENLEAYFNELTGNDISTTFSNFWDALDDLNDHVEDLSTRANAASVAQTFAESVQSTRQKIYDYRANQNHVIVETVGTVNEVCAQIASLNAAIMKMESSGATGVKANDLRDQREVLVKQLSGLMDVNVSEEKNGSLIVAQHGRMLVFENQTFELTTTRVERGGLMVDDIVFAADRAKVVMADGAVYGMVQMRDVVALSYQNDLDQFAGEVIWNFNRQFSQGVGLTGLSEMTADYRIIDPAVTLDKLQYEFTPQANTFQIKDGVFEVIVYDVNSGEAKHVPIDIDLTSSADDKRTILYSTEAVETAPGVWTYNQPENSLVRKMQDAFDSVAAGAFTVSLDKLNRVSIVANSESTQFAFGRDDTGVLAALGLNTFFSGNNAQTITVNQTMQDNPQLFAAADAFVDGNQINIRSLTHMRIETTMKNGTASFEDFYNGVVGRLGIESARTASLFSAQADIKVSVENQRESLSGVNMDEEMTKMSQYLTAYKASSQFISVVNQMFDSLLSIVR